MNDINEILIIKILEENMGEIFYKFGVWIL